MNSYFIFLNILFSYFRLFFFFYVLYHHDVSLQTIYLKRCRDGALWAMAPHPNQFEKKKN